MTKLIGLLAGLIFYSAGYTQLTELYLDPAKVFAGATHYKLPTGNQTLPGALVNDTFSYDPNSPMSAYPFQAWKKYPEYSYLFMLPENVPERDWTSFAFPEEGVDSNFLAVNFEIPVGKRIAYLDCWGQSDLTVSHNTKDIVIILKNVSNHWYFVDWDDINPYNQENKAYARFNFKAAGVTDNLLKNATQIALCRTKRGPGINYRFRMAEIRIALEEDPNVGDVTPPLLSATSGEIYFDFEITGYCNEDGTVYLLPKGNYTSIEEVQNAAIYKTACFKDKEFTFIQPEMKSGTFTLISLDGGGNLSTASDDIIFTQRPYSTKANIDHIELLLTQTISTEIDTADKIVSILLAAGSELENLFALIYLSDGATTTFKLNTFIDFNDTVSFTVVAEDGVTSNKWFIAVTIEEKEIEEEENPSDVKERLLNTTFTLYPTPTRDVLNIRTALSQFNIQLYSMSGRFLIEKTNSKIIDVGHLTNGTYIVRFSYENKIITKKIVKQGNP